MSDTDAHFSRSSASDTASAVPFAGMPASHTTPSLSKHPNIAPEHAKLLRMVQRGCHVPLPVVDDDAVLSLHVTDDEPAIWSNPVVLMGPFGTIEFAEGARLMHALSGVDISKELKAEEDRWEWMQAALVGRLGNTPFSSADRLTRGTKSKPAESITLRVTLRTGHHSIVTHARAKASSWLDLLGRTAWDQERLPFSEWPDLPVDIPVRIARHTLPTDVLNTLDAGDIIVPDSPRFTCEGEGMIQFGSISAHVRYQMPSSLEVIAVEQSHSLEPGMNVDGEGMDGAAYDEEDTGGDQSASHTTLDFELGKARMLLKDVRALDVGSTIRYSNGSTAAIAISSAGHILGHGEIVDIQGQLGIRITQWGSP